MSAETSRPQKRARVEGPGKAAADWDDGSIIRDKDLWLDDGNIILVAEKTAFKVYKGLLAVQSPVFAGMLAGSSPDATEHSDGTPVVHLPDSPTDLKHLLHTLLPTTNVDIYRATHLCGYDFERLFSVTRLAHKYQIEEIEEQALECLKPYFTHQFSAWEEAKLVVEMEDCTMSIGVVNLARLTGHLKMLPVALYDCCLAGGAIAKGWQREDGSVERLSDEDLERCIDGFEALFRARSDMPKKIHSMEASDLCSSGVLCKNALTELYEYALSEYNRWRWAEPLSQSVTIKAHPLAQSLCSSCRRALHKRDYEARHALWRELPRIFDLEVEGWDKY